MTTPPDSTPAMPRLVVCAALRHPQGGIITGPRHFDPIMRRQIMTGETELERLGWESATQGFVDQRGTFLTRTEAWAVASAAGQIRRRCGGDTANGGTLYSKSLY